MSQDRDTADVLSNMLPPSFPPAARKEVFLAGGHDEELLECWSRWGGDSYIVLDSARAGECGICLFRRWETGGKLPSEFFKLVLSFYDKGGDVFEYQPEEKLFRRIGRYIFGLYYEPK